VLVAAFVAAALAYPVLVMLPSQAAEQVLSAGRPVLTSSVESPAHTGDKAVDGDTATRWASALGVDPQWIMVDLGSQATITRVTLRWEAAYARAYTIQVSANGTAWTTVAAVTNGDGGTDQHTLSATGRHIRVHGTQRGTQWGYSLWEFDVYGTAGPTAPPTTPPPSAGTPVGINGQLRVCGLKLCNQYGRPIQLRGMSTHGLQWYPQCVNDASLDALARDWRADHLRLSMYIQEGGYETDPQGFTQRMHTLIEKVSARGMYVIVDWHQLTPGDPNHNLSRARTFFAEIAARHGHRPNILYDIANEPNQTPWSRVKAYHEQVIPVIRASDPDAVILLGTHGWASLGVSDGGSEADIVANPVNATNIMYTFHFYAASHGGQYLQTLSRAADRIPVFVTEFGTQEASGDGGNDFAAAQQYLDLMAQKKISWTNWNYSDDSRSGAVFRPGTCPGGPFAGTSALKPAGVWIRDRIRDPADDFPTS